MKSDGRIELDFSHITDEEMLKKSELFYLFMNKRRSVRNFSDKKLPEGIIDKLILTAGTAPSGANMQPWHFAIVQSPETKKKIRIAAEKEEKEFYTGKAPEEWLNALSVLGTDWRKPFLEKAPALIVIFEKKYSVDEKGNKIKHYYTKESVGIACGMMISAVHNAGLVSLTHTPSPMNFLNGILGRPENEKPYLILVIGYPGKDVMVPDIKRKQLGEISSFH